MINDNDLKCNGQCSKLMYTLAILMKFFKHSVFLTITLKYFHKILSGLKVDELLHLSIILVNSLFEKRDHVNCTDLTILDQIEYLIKSLL